MSTQKTSWGHVAEWYDDLLKDEGSYQTSVILPNMLRIASVQRGEVLLDVGCGQGLFAHAFAKEGAHVIGVDIAPELIARAKKEAKHGELFHIASADAMPFVKKGSADIATIILSLQNIENMNGVLAECARVMKPGGRLLLVLNHPAFRIPGHSGWGWEGAAVQYRRTDAYLSESRAAIAMHPGSDAQVTTTTFHRSLQLYFKALAKHGFSVTRLEEWISHRTSQPGPRKKAEDVARKEFPLFLFLEARHA